MKGDSWTYISVVEILVSAWMERQKSIRTDALLNVPVLVWTRTERQCEIKTGQESYRVGVDKIQAWEISMDKNKKYQATVRLKSGGVRGIITNE